MVGATGFEPATSCSRSRRATKLRYAPSLTTILPFPGVLPDQLHEDAGRVFGDLRLPVDLVHDAESLRVLRTHGHHEPTAFPQLLNERRGHRPPPPRPPDGIERGPRRPAPPARDRRPPRPRPPAPARAWPVPTRAAPRRPPITAAAS